MIDLPPNITNIFYSPTHFFTNPSQFYLLAKLLLLFLVFSLSLSLSKIHLLLIYLFSFYFFLLQIYGASAIATVLPQILPHPSTKITTFEKKDGWKRDWKPKRPFENHWRVCGLNVWGKEREKFGFFGVRLAKTM